MKPNDKKRSENVQSNLLMKIIIRVLLIFIFLGLLFFLTAGSLRYTEAWIYIIVIFVPALFVIAYFYKKDPGFIGSRLLERREKEQMHKSIQNIFSIVLFIGLLIPGFDFRFGWSNVPLSFVIISDAFVFLGYMLIVRVMEENRYASAIIQITEGQKIIETGPYKIVRHPMYTGGLIFMLFTPLALGSYWALIPFSVSTIPAIILRIINEEKMLIANLQGYSDYCRKTKYRLIPFVW
jgi:protein-S-isoprenylcysteine O-methyltransferase Ste14